VRIIVGLGNPGVHYERTRHNIGFQVVDRLAETHQILISTKRFKSLYGTGWIDSQKVSLIKPMTFMNQSGEAVKRAVNFFQIGIEDLIVIHDDLDLPFGRLRFKRRGGNGGHQGVGSIIETIGQNDFLRLKVGIGRPPRGMDPADYVLTPFEEIEHSKLKAILSTAVEALEVLLIEGMATAMNRYQKRDRKENG
jgi:PTH1 family peptidyl-tRNA hydrolase